MDYLKEYDLSTEDIEEIEENLNENDYSELVIHDKNVKLIIDYLLSIGINNIKDIILKKANIFYDNINFIKEKFNNINEDIINLINEDAYNLDIIGI